MKRIPLLLFIVALIGLEITFTGTRAQQTPTDEVALIQLPVPLNVIGTFARSVSNDGKRIVFDSINDYNDNNVDSNTEIWAYDVDSKSVIQITDTKDIKDPADSSKTLTRINNVTPVVSGDGTKIVFASNASLGDATNENGNYEIYLADLPRGATKATFTRITNTGRNFDGEGLNEISTNYEPTINDNGTLISFASTRAVFNQIPNGAASFTALKEGPNNSEPPDGNAELFLYSVTQRQYSQVTVSRDVDATVNFLVKGFNSRPVLSGNGQSLVFLSAFNYPGQNANRNQDFNGEIFLYKIGDPANTFTQVTQTNSLPGANSDLPSVPANGVINVLASFTHPLSADGTKLVFESSGNFAGKNGDTNRTREVFLADLSGSTPVFTQVTDQPAANVNTSDFNFFPSINSTGTFITFATVQNLTPASTSSISTDNADGSKEAFRYEIATAKFRQLTYSSPSVFVFDQRGTTFSPFIDDTGSLATFNYIAQLLEPNALAVSDLFQAVVVPVTSVNSQEAKIANAASYDATQVARGSIVAAFGTQLANSTQSTPSADLPFILGGVRVNVRGIAARLIFVSAGQINFVIPSGVATGDAIDFTINNNGVQSAGKVKIVDAAPGVFSINGAGTGPAAAQCGRVSSDGTSFVVTNPPCSVGNESQFDVLTIYGTGWRNSSSVQVKIGDQTLTPIFSGPQPNFVGLDQINVSLTKELAGKTDVDLSVVIPLTTPIESNKTKVSFLPFEEALTVANAASFETGTVAPASSALATGTKLSDNTASGPPGFQIAGVTATVAGLPAILTFVSPAQVNFVVPQVVKPARLVEVVINNNGTISRGRVEVLQAAPGLFTTTSDGSGRVLAQCGAPNPDGSITFTNPPCKVGTEANPNILRVFGTGWRNADQTVLKVGDIDLTPTFSGALPNSFGVDLIDAKLVPSLAGRTDVDVIVTATVGSARRSSKAGVKISFTP